MRTHAELIHAAAAVRICKRLEAIEAGGEPTEDYKTLAAIEATLLWVLGENDSEIAMICASGVTAARAAVKRNAERN